MFVSPLCIEEDGKESENLEALDCQIKQISTQLASLQQQLTLLEKRRADAVRQFFPANTTPIREIAINAPPFVGDKPNKQKVDLYLSLFNGRKDVYAERWKNKAGKIGYSFKCKNRSIKDLCTYQCASCQNNEYLPITHKVIENHFNNENEDDIGAAGIYVMQKDNTTNLIAFDFDEKDWKNAALAILRELRNAGFDAAMERSRSGNGAHIWLFFSSAISATKVREFGQTVITLAAKASDSVSFDSYDRIFPSQNTLPKDKGLGNLILLPFSGPARAQGNTVFVDKDFTPYPDQWAFLASLRKTDESQIDSYLSLHTEGLGYTKFSLLPDELDVSQDASITLRREDAIHSPVLYLSTGISLLKSSFSASALNTFKRMASYPNPQFSLLQNMRKYINRTTTPRICQCFDENEQVLWLPRGLLQSLSTLFEKAGIPIYT